MSLQHKRLTDRALSRVVVSVGAPRVAFYLNIGVKKQGLTHGIGAADSSLARREIPRAAQNDTRSGTVLSGRCEYKFLALRDCETHFIGGAKAAYC